MCHRWSLHRKKSNIRMFVPDTCICPICQTNFHTRNRLVKHLMENRVRSKHRSTTCGQDFMAQNPSPVPESKLQEIEARDAAERKSARKEGHSNVLICRHAVAGRPHILKGKTTKIVNRRDKQKNRRDSQTAGSSGTPDCTSERHSAAQAATDIRRTRLRDKTPVGDTWYGKGL